MQMLDFTSNAEILYIYLNTQYFHTNLVYHWIMQLACILSWFANIKTKLGHLQIAIV